MKAIDERMQHHLKTRAAIVSITSNSVLIILKLAAGLFMHSVSVISEAVHSAIDLVAAIVAFMSVRHSGKPADKDHHYGHGKIENISATIEALLIFGAAVYIIYQAVQKLEHGNIEVESLGLGTLVMAASAAVNFIVSRYLFKVAHLTDSAALRGDALHLRTDVWTSLGVLGGLAAIKLTGLEVLDPVVAIVVALLIIKAAWELTKESFSDILDTRIPAKDEELIHRVLAEHSHAITDYHKLRTRKSGHVRYIDLHIVVPGRSMVKDAHSLSDLITSRIKERLANSHVLVHIEPCDGMCNGCHLDCKSMAHS
ncbi:MAG TPA: cation diffusion facilitator family transporter [Nitrospirota bacterium]|nr:cation diffusion facilitator family transporter [Nitrospirota bacterium]